LGLASKAVDRRGLLKLLGAAGATTAFVSACSAVPIGQQSSPSSSGAGAPAGAAPAGGVTSANGVAVTTRPKGPGGNLNWKAGDSLQFLPAETIPAGKAADQLAALPKERLLRAFERMTASRMWETKMKDLFVEGKDGLYGAFHPYVGEEAISNGVITALNEDDYIVSTHRGHGHLIAKGGDLNKMSAEIFFKQTGANHGFGGSMHIVEVDKGILGMNGIVGASYHLAAGAALSANIRGTKQVSIAFAGDGAAQSPYFFSAIRSSTNYKLPVIFVIENNFQFIQVPSPTVIPTANISDYVTGLGIPATTIDGNDLAAVHSATADAVARARAGQGPSFIEAITYRWYDHAGFAGAKSGIDAAFGLPYRSDDEVKQWMTRDPIKRYKTFLVGKNLATDAELTKIEQDVLGRVEASVDFARKSPDPDPKAGLTNVYANAPVAATQFYAAAVVDGLA
jgi:pyruvate dehydrogenase E1 component alpha subunit